MLADSLATERPEFSSPVTDAALAVCGAGLVIALVLRGRRVFLAQRYLRTQPWTCRRWFEPA